MEFLIIFIPIFVLAGLALYFLPSIIAFKCEHTDKHLILILNAVLGWTFIGWILILLWAMTDTKINKVLNIANNDNIDKLSRLADLKDRGAITEEEFNTQKERILNS